MPDLKMLGPNVRFRTHSNKDCSYILRPSTKVVDVRTSTTPTQLY